MFGKHYLKTYQGVFLLAFRLLDLLLLGAIAYLMLPYLLGGSADAGDTILTMFLSALTFLLISDRTHIYRPWRGKRFRYELLLLIFLSGATVVFTCMFLFLAGKLYLQWETIEMVFSWFALLTSALALTRLFIRTILKSMRRLGFNRRRIVFVGISEQVDHFLLDLKRHPEFGIEPLGYIDDRQTKRGDNAPPLARIGKVADLPRLVKELDIDQVWFAYPVSAAVRTASGIEELRHSAVAIRQILDSGPEPARVTGILGMPLIDIDIAMTDGVLGGLFKSAQDKIAALLILTAISPLMLAIAIGVKLSSPGPIFYRQTRVTWKNEPFEILKFRSMPVDAEFAGGSASWASDHKTTTRFGSFLRASSMDELPQFINVLRGEMSIIGPRPERPVYVDQFKDQIPSYMKKHRVKAGITGWAQVNGLRGDTDLNARIEHDLYYIRNWSPLLDIEIVLRTIYNGFFKKHT